MIIKTQKDEALAFIMTIDGIECPFIELISSSNQMSIDPLIKKFKSYIAIDRDLNHAKNSINKLKNLNENEHDFMESLLENSIIAYARSFVSSKKRNCQIDANEVFKNKPDLMKIHRNLINLRHKFSAHDDNTEYDAILIYVALTPKPLPQKVIEVYRGIVRTSGFDINFYQKSLVAIDCALEWVKIKIDKLYENILFEIKNIDIAELYKSAIFPDTLSSNVKKITIPFMKP